MKPMKFFLPVCAAVLCLVSCKKAPKETPDPQPPPVDTTVVVITPPVDPPIAGTMGFFLDDWQQKTFATPEYKDTAVSTTAAYTITVDASQVLTKIPRSNAGANSNLWMTQIITEAPLVSALTNLHPHIIRFPGGSISDVFFWNAPKNTPPADAPAQLVNANGTKTAANYWYGTNAESWTFSVDNYYQMLQQTNNSGMITINYGYARYSTAADPVAAAAHLAADWVRYDNGRTKYWEIGNENFGDWEAGYRIDPTQNKDGQPQTITGGLYAQHFSVFADSMRTAAQEAGKTIYIGAVLYDSPPQSWNTDAIKNWNTTLIPTAGNKPDFYIVHHYYSPYNQQTAAADVLASAPTETKQVMDFAKQAVQTGGVAEKPIALTEWNINAVGLKQQVSQINGLHGVMVAGEALKNGFGMTARWDLANGWNNGDDHGMFNNGDEPGAPKWNARPIFYDLYFFEKFLGDRLVATSTAGNANIQTYASTFSSGQAAVTLLNTAATATTLEFKFKNFSIGNRFYWYSLTGGTDNGEFSGSVFVNGQGPSGASGGPANYTTIKAYSATAASGIRLTLPPRSMVCLAVDKK